MTLPEGFLFSQSSLQAYVTCPRKFELAYIHHTAWPALRSRPALESERLEQMGSAFHRLAHQHLLGLPASRLQAAVASTPNSQGLLERWWEAFMSYGDNLPPAPGEIAAIRKLPEISLVMPASFGEFGSFPYRLFARYDALALVDSAEGRTVHILDWKTSHFQPRRQRLLEQLQSRVYPYVLVNAGAEINSGRHFQPSQVEMIYWYAEFPDQPIHLPYSTSQARRDAEFLARLIERIELGARSGFEPAPKSKACSFCVYRSYCDYGTDAGDLSAAGDDIDLPLEFNPVDEIEL